MYIPKYSDVQDQDLIFDVLKNHSFATVITAPEGEPTANHYPLLIEKNQGKFVLSTHLARSNPQCEHLQSIKKCLVLFQGPHLYISPQYYRNPLNVPTWNYVAVHARCTVEVINEAAEIEMLISKTVTHFESENKTHWKYELPRDYVTRLLGAIVGFRMSVTEIEAKFKLSQNRKQEDYEATVAALADRSDPAAHEILRYMRKTTPSFQK